MRGIFGRSSYIRQGEPSECLIFPRDGIVTRKGRCGRDGLDWVLVRLDARRNIAFAIGYVRRTDRSGVEDCVGAVFHPPKRSVQSYVFTGAQRICRRLPHWVSVLLDPTTWCVHTQARDWLKADPTGMCSTCQILGFLDELFDRKIERISTSHQFLCTTMNWTAFLPFCIAIHLTFLGASHKREGVRLSGSEGDTMWCSNRQFGNPFPLVPFSFLAPSNIYIFVAAHELVSG